MPESDRAAGMGTFMLEDAVYYSRREAEERALAEQTADLRAQRVHQTLAEKYAQLAQRMMAKLEGP
jgi:hypothetical protein